MASSRARKSRVRNAGEVKPARRATKVAEEAEQLSGSSFGEVDERHVRRFEAPGGVGREVREVEGHDESVIAASRNGGDGGRAPGGNSTGSTKPPL